LGKWAMWARSVRGKFFKTVDHALVLPGVLRPAADMGEGQPGQQVGDRPLAVDDAEALLDHPLQVDPPPAHDTVRRRIGAGLDDLGQLRHLSLAQPAPTARSRAFAQARRPLRVEAKRPVAQRLAVHATDLCGASPAHPVIDGGQRQQPPDLPVVAARLRQAAKLEGVVVTSKSDGPRHGDSPSPALNHAKA